MNLDSARLTINSITLPYRQKEITHAMYLPQHQSQKDEFIVWIVTVGTLS